MTRNQFYPKELQYLFSFDIDLLSAQARNRAELFGGRALSTRCAAPAKPDAWPVYHALGEAQAAGRDAVVGSIQLIRERTSFDLKGKMGEVKASMVLETEDAVTIQAEYEGLFRAPGRFALALLDAFPEVSEANVDAALAADRALEARAFVAARFDTGAAKYRWLTNSQCVGYGRISVTNGQPMRATFDIYQAQ